MKRESGSMRSMQTGGSLNLHAKRSKHALKTTLSREDVQSKFIKN
jgi:hypothetical protein